MDRAPVLVAAALVNDVEHTYDLSLLGESEMAERIRSRDWTATPLGPIETWSSRLLTGLTAILNSQFPFVIYWGPELICLYNSAAIPTLGDLHPRALGEPASTLLEPMWDVVGKELQAIMDGGPATWAEDTPLPFARTGEVEEAYYTYSYSPIRDESGSIEGVMLTTHETTPRVLGERQLRTLQNLAERMGTAGSIHEVCVVATDELVRNPDFVFALMFLNDRTALRLAASSGFSSTGDSPQINPLDWPPHTALSSRRAVAFAIPAIRAGLPRKAVVASIADAGSQPIGALMVGMADHRPANERQLEFIELVAKQIGSALTAHHAIAIAAATAEREQIEADLHDSVQQQWIAAEIKLGLARQAVAGSPDQAIRLLDEVATELDDALMQMRDIAQGRHPALLQMRGLEAALAQACRRAAIEATVYSNDVGRLDADVEDCVYYVCLEALQNAERHGGFGTRVSMDLQRHWDRITLRVTDTGPGFDLLRVNGGRGLGNMRARVAALGGTLDVTSEPGRGTIVSGSVPFRHSGAFVPSGS